MLNKLVEKLLFHGGHVAIEITIYCLGFVLLLEYLYVSHIASGLHVYRASWYTGNHQLLYHEYNFLKIAETTIYYIHTIFNIKFIVG